MLTGKMATINMQGEFDSVDFRNFSITLEILMIKEKGDF